MGKKELYDRIVCALTHNIPACDSCKKCGETCTEARINLARELAELLDCEVPWRENND